MDLQKQCNEQVQIPNIVAVSRWRQFWAKSWHDVLVFLGLRPDWLNPDNAPPAFPECKPHKFIWMPDLRCCPKCGGGKNHAIHQLSKGDDVNAEG